MHAAALADLDEHDGEPTEDITREVLATIRVMAALQDRWGERACRRYVVSFCSSASDLEAVLRLARYALGDRADGIALDVVPLFETGEDLRRSADVLDEWVVRRGGPPERLEVMLGYSDSAKDVGPLSATLLLYDAQASLADWAERHGVALDPVPRPGRVARPRRRSGEPRDPRAAARQRRRPVQGHRAG